jgi:glycosyltransferase involved in cell wall biosynthesis
MPKKSLLIFCKTLAIGGAEKQALTLAKLLLEKGESVILINWCGNIIDARNSDFLMDNSIRYIGLQGNPIKKFMDFIRVIKNEKISIVLSYLTLANFISGVSKFFNRSLISIGGIRTEKLPFYKFFFEKLTHNFLNDATVFNNYSAKGKFEKRGFNSGKIFVIHNTISANPVYIRENPSKEVVIVSVSRFVEPKDFVTALYSFKQAVEKNRGKELKYRLVGYGPLEGRIRSMISLLDLEKEVTILINPPNIHDILKSCDIYLSTSLFEGLSNSIMEAMSTGLPVIATDVGDNRYLIEDGYNGYIVPCKDVELIAEKLEYLIDFEEIRKEFGNNSRIKIAREFSEKELLEHYYELLSSLLTKKD